MLVKFDTTKSRRETPGPTHPSFSLSTALTCDGALKGAGPLRFCTVSRHFENKEVSCFWEFSPAIAVVRPWLNISGLRQVYRWDRECRKIELKSKSPTPTRTKKTPRMPHLSGTCRVRGPLNSDVAPFSRSSGAKNCRRCLRVRVVALHLANNRPPSLASPDIFSTLSHGLPLAVIPLTYLRNSHPYLPRRIMPRVPTIPRVVH